MTIPFAADIRLAEFATEYAEKLLCGCGRRRCNCRGNWQAKGDDRAPSWVQDLRVEYFEIQLFDFWIDCGARVGRKEAAARWIGACGRNHEDRQQSSTIEGERWVKKIDLISCRLCELWTQRRCTAHRRYTNTENKQRHNQATATNRYWRTQFMTPFKVSHRWTTLWMWVCKICKCRPPKPYPTAIGEQERRRCQTPTLRHCRRPR